MVVEVNVREEDAAAEADEPWRAAALREDRRSDEDDAQEAMRGGRVVGDGG